MAGRPPLLDRIVNVIGKSEYALIAEPLGEILEKYHSRNEVWEEVERGFAEQFPKTCPLCSETYYDRHDYLERTTALRKGQLVIEDRFICEERNCSCGTTISLLARSVRDVSAVGLKRREIFDTCVVTLLASFSSTEEEIKSKLRDVFRLITFDGHGLISPANEV